MMKLGNFKKKKTHSKWRLSTQNRTTLCCCCGRC